MSVFTVENEQKDGKFDKIGDRIARLMKERGFSRRELAGMAGVTDAAMSRYQKKERTLKADIVENLATALGTTSDYLTTG